MKNKRFVDLSVTIEGGSLSDYKAMIPKITYVNHSQGFEDMKQHFPGITKNDLPKGLGWAYEQVELTTHSGTHLDAPYHYHPTMDGGKKAYTIDEIPLSWCYGNGIKLDFRHKSTGSRISVNDVINALKKIDYKLKKNDIVLAHTGAERFWGTTEYINEGAGFTKETTLWFVKKGVKIVGTDAWSWDRPFKFVADEFKREKKPQIVWEAHYAGIEKTYLHMEKLHNLEELPAKGFTICCFPIKIKNASAGWVRAVAIIDE